MNDTVTALILAGGNSSRFWPLSWSKPLISFCGKTILERTCVRLRDIGIDRVVVVTNVDDEKEVRRLAVSDKSVEVLIQPEAKGMGDAVLVAQDTIKDSPCLILNAPDVVETRLFDDMKQYIVHRKMFIAGKKVDRYIDVGYLKLDGQRVVGIVEKPGEGREPSTFINLVFHFITNPVEFCDILASTQSDRDDIYEKALSEYLRKHEAVILPFEGFWTPLKYPWHTLDLMEYFLSKLTDYRSKDLIVKPNVVIEGHVHIEEGVKIFENSKIVGPCYIGKNVVIGNNSMVRGSHIGNGSVVGFNSDITRSYIGDGCWFHGNYIGDSVLSENVSMGSGTVLANFRLDEESIWSTIKGIRINTTRSKLGAMVGKNVRIGVNTSIMPGVKIGEESFIGAGIIVDQDVPDKSFCMYPPSLPTITKNQKTVLGKNRNSYKESLR